jgi:uncharacterized protein YPO0396
MDPVVEATFQRMREEMVAMETRMKADWQAEAFNIGKRLEEFDKVIEKMGEKEGDGK